MSAKREDNCVVIPPSSIGRERQAIRWAINNFEEWHNATNIPPAHSGYYYEILALIEQAAQIGFGAAHGICFDEIMRRINKDQDGLLDTVS